MMLGNIPPWQWGDKFGVKLSAKDLGELRDNYSNQADLSGGAFHCYDIPRCVVVWDTAADRFMEIIKPYSAQFNELLEVKVMESPGKWKD